MLEDYIQENNRSKMTQTLQVLNLFFQVIQSSE